MPNSEQKLVQVIYEGQSIEVTPEVAAVLKESDTDISSQQRKKRRQNASKQVIAGDIEDLVLTIPINFEDEAILSIDIKMLREAILIANMTEKQRRRFEAHYFDFLTYREIAEMEGINHKTAVESVHYALKKIKIFFQKHPPKRL